MLTQVEPELFFINLLTVDRIKHFVWRYVDPGTDVPGPNPHEAAVDRMTACGPIVGEYARWATS